MRAKKTGVYYKPIVFFWARIEIHTKQSFELITKTKKIIIKLRKNYSFAIIFLFFALPLSTPTKKNNGSQGRAQFS